jgi:curved DNA-binding protein CbpA
MLTLYEIIKVSSQASAAEIRRSFYRLAIKYHPDKNKSPDAARRFRVIHYAYQILNNEEKRAQYDQKLLKRDFACGSAGSKAQNSTANKAVTALFMKYYRRFLKKPCESLLDKTRQRICRTKTVLWTYLRSARKKTTDRIMAPVNLFQKQRSRIKQITFLKLLSLRRRWHSDLSRVVHKMRNKSIAIWNGLRGLVEKIYGWILAPVYLFLRCRRRVLQAKARTLLELSSLRRRWKSIVRSAVHNARRKKITLGKKLKSVRQRAYESIAASVDFFLGLVRKLILKSRNRG